MKKNIKGGCQSVKKVVPHDSKSDLPLVFLESRKKFVKTTCVQCEDSIGTIDVVVSEGIGAPIRLSTFEQGKRVSGSGMPHEWTLIVDPYDLQAVHLWSIQQGDRHEFV